MHSEKVQPFMYRNWLVEGVGFYYMGKWIRKHECQRKTLSIGILLIGSIVTTAEYRICGRLEFYFGNLPMVYGMLALGKTVHIKDNILSMIGSKHSLHLYLYSPFASSDDFVSDNQTSGSYYSSGCFRNDLACHAGVVHKGNRET